MHILIYLIQLRVTIPQIKQQAKNRIFTLIEQRFLKVYSVLQ